MYKLKNEGEMIAVAGVAQTFSGEVSDDLYEMIVKIEPKLKEKFEKVESAPEKSDE